MRFRHSFLTVLQVFIYSNNIITVTCTQIPSQTGLAHVFTGACWVVQLVWALFIYLLSGKALDHRKSTLVVAHRHTHIYLDTLELRWYPL